MTLDEALELPFNEYLLWCHGYCREKAQMLEALWAKRYWYHKVTGTY